MKTRLWAQIKDDWRANGRDWTRPGFRALAVYRFGVWRLAIEPKLLRAPLTVIYRFLFRHCRTVYGIELPYTATVGRGVVIEHQGGIVVHGAAVIGDRCIIRQGCTLGIKRISERTMAPFLEEGVELGAGAVVLGPVRIGAGATIGANAVVLRDVPPGALAAGVPAKLYSTRRSQVGEAEKNGGSVSPRPILAVFCGTADLIDILRKKRFKDLSANDH
jgi:serine O-acetyltransferase